MSEPETYYQYAEECRKLAATTQNPEHKKQFEEMARAWMVVANERAKEATRNVQAETHQSRQSQKSPSI